MNKILIIVLILVSFYYLFYVKEFFQNNEEGEDDNETTTKASETTTKASETTTKASETTTKASETTTKASETTTSVSLEEMDAINKMSKNSCMNTDNKCNSGFIPYKESDFALFNNPITNYPFTSNEKDEIKNRYSEKCKLSSHNAKEVRCCDPLDVNLENLIGDENVKKKVAKFKKVDVTSCNGAITKMRVCNSDNCGEGNWKAPKVYEVCKMLDLEEEDYSDKKEINLDKLLPDCSTNTCDNTEILLSLDPDYKKNKEASATEDYYLISAIKDDNVDYLKSHHNKGNSVNKKLLYGYEGNTIFHHAIYYNSLKCIEYLLTTDYDYSIVNKDLNSVLHIACLKGNYDATFKLLKHGANVICKNKYGDTALHSAVRSGSYNCVKILIENNGESCLIIKNKYGEIPLHTAVYPIRFDLEEDNEKRKNLKDRMNFNIVKILVEYGSDIHSKNNNGDTILKTLSKKYKSIVREKIRTFIQQKYYFKYSKDEYAKLLQDFPEVRPFELNTEVDPEMEETHEEYENNIDFKNIVEFPTPDIRDENLYVPKKTRVLKDKIPEKNEIEEFRGYRKSSGFYSGVISVGAIVVILLVTIILKLK